MGCNYKHWAVTIKNAPNTKLVYKILFMDFENLKFSKFAIDHTTKPSFVYKTTESNYF